MHFLYSKHFCIIFLCFICSFSVFGQDVTSFKEMELTVQSKFIEENQHLTTDITSYIDIYLNKGIQSKDLYHEAKAYYYLCLFYRKKKDPKRAHEFIDKAIAIAKQRKDNGQLGLFLHRKGTIYYVHANNTKALDYYLEAYDLLKNNKNKLQVLLNLRFDIAAIKLKTKHYNEASIRFENLANTYDSLLKKQSKISYASYIHILLGLADSYAETGQLDKAMQLYDKAIRTSISYNYDFETYIGLGGKGKVLNRKKQYSKALLSINEAIQIASSNSNSKGVLPFLYAHKGESYFGLKEYKKAVFNFSKTDSIIKADSLDFIELDYIYKFLAIGYAELEQYEKAKQHFITYTQKNDLNTKERIKLRETLFNDYDLQKISDALAEEKEEKGLFKNRFYISLFIVLSLIIVLLFFVMYHKHKQQKNKEQFEALMEELAIREKEQKKIKPNFVISDDTSQGILQQLDQFEASKMYLNSKYNLSILAKKFDTNSNYLSKVINTYKEKTFSQYLNDLRINFIIMELKNNTKLRSYTIQAIAEEAGFKKAESFSKAFKKKTGFNPSFYIKNLDKQPIKNVSD